MNKNVFKVLIVDDEPEARNLLRVLLSEIKNTKFIGEADNSEHALYLLVEHYPDLILMDINMPGKTGMDLVRLIKAKNIDVPVVFVSAFKEYAVNAIRNEVYDFLLKPIDKEELRAVIEKHKRLNRKGLSVRLTELLDSIQEETKVRINSNNSFILVNPAEIVYCEAQDGITTIYLSNGNIEIANNPLKRIKQNLASSDFFQMGRSLLINVNYIRSIDKITDSCVLLNSTHKWEVKSSHKSIKKLLNERFSHA